MNTHVGEIRDATCGDSSPYSSAMQAEIEAIFANQTALRDSHIEQLLTDFRGALNQGKIRAASQEGHWQVHSWIKKGLALHVRFGRLSQDSPGLPIDLDTLPRKIFSIEDGVRVTDSSCFVRDGSCISPGCTLMPNTIVQMGAFVGPDTIVSSGVGIGLCAQVGMRAHLDPGVQIQGHIQPLEALPAIICDGACIGANCVIGMGVIVGTGALIFPGTVLLQQTRIYDPSQKLRYAARPNQPLVIPSGAIVIPGARSLAQGPTQDMLLSAQVAVVAGSCSDQTLPQMVMDRLLEI